MARGEVDYDCVDIHGAGSVRKRPLFEAEPTTMTLLPKQTCLFMVTYKAVHGKHNFCENVPFSPSTTLTLHSLPDRSAKMWLAGLVSLTLISSTLSLPLHLRRRQTPELEAATDRLLFSTWIEDFLAARAAQDPPGLDYSSDGCSSSPDNPFGVSLSLQETFN